MSLKHYDLLIAGSGFGGSLLAMIAKRAGKSVLLIEKGTHPRFAIGESTTPLSNLLLEEISERYDLPHLKPLTKWGTWQQTNPELACGLKRGFSFYHHTLGAQSSNACSREEQLLVAASPNDAIADTHWYRADFDHFVLQEAQSIGVDYLDQVALSTMEETDNGVVVEGERCGERMVFQGSFLVDATGPRGFLHRALNLRELEFPGFPKTQGLYTHFSSVAPFGIRQPEGSAEIPPYPPDDAALHHVFDGGWIWVLPFNNGLTSAGVAATDDVANRLRFSEGGAAWQRLMDLLPGVRGQFADAPPELPFVHARGLSFLSETMAGRRWAMLPSAAAFIDPLLSTGFPLTLLGVSRLGEIVSNAWDAPDFNVRIEAYAAQTSRELQATAQLIGALYATMADFPTFVSVSFLYFAAASFAETARRLNRHDLASSFLLCDDPVYGPDFTRLCQQARESRTEAERSDLRTAILLAIEPLNVAGLGEETRRNWFPADPEDLFRAAHKVGGASQADIRRLIERCNFQPDRG